MFIYGLLEYSDHFKWFLGSVGISKTMYRNKKMFILKNLRDKNALDYICHIFKLKSLNGMLKYKIKILGKILCFCFFCTCFNKKLMGGGLVVFFL